MLLRCSVPSARHLVEHALVLVRQLPVVWHALADGRIDESRARVVCEVLRWQAASVGGPFADADIEALAARAVGWAERGCPPTTLRERLQAGLVAADPEAADRRREQRVRAGDVTTTPTGDGHRRAAGRRRRGGSGCADAGPADRLREEAEGRRRHPPLGALRIAVMDALITRPGSTRPRGRPRDDHRRVRDLIDPDQVAALRDLVTSDRRRRPPRRTPSMRTTAGRRCPRGMRQAPERRRRGRRGRPAGDARGGARAAARIDALGLVDPTNGDFTLTLTDRGRTLAVASPAELLAATRTGTASAHHRRPPPTPRPPPSTATCAPATGTAASPAAAAPPRPATPTTSSRTARAGRPASATSPCSAGTTTGSRPTHRAGRSGSTPTGPARHHPGGAPSPHGRPGWTRSSTSNGHRHRRTTPSPTRHPSEWPGRDGGDQASTSRRSSDHMVWNEPSASTRR